MAADTFLSREDIAKRYGKHPHTIKLLSASKVVYFSDPRKQIGQGRTYYWSLADFIDFEARNPDRRFAKAA
jgi:hypothetical protein